MREMKVGEVAKNSQEKSMRGRKARGVAKKEA
jgi:hypothetical protein